MTSPAAQENRGQGNQGTDTEFPGFRTSQRIRCPFLDSPVPDFLARPSPPQRRGYETLCRFLHIFDEDTPANTKPTSSSAARTRRKCHSPDFFLQRRTRYSIPVRLETAQPSYLMVV